jgi:hypothetical protein
MEGRRRFGQGGLGKYAYPPLGATGEERFFETQVVIAAGNVRKYIHPGV